MPELPDVEGFKQTASLSLNQKIKAVVSIKHAGEKVRTIQNISPEKLQQACQGLFLQKLNAGANF